MVWILIWAGLLVLVLYSPVGSPDLYSSANYTAGNQSVTFKNGEILNAPNVNYGAENNYNELNVPDYNSERRTNYAVNNYSATAKNSPSMYTNYSVQTSSYQNTQISSGNNGIGGGTFISSNRSSNNNAGASSTGFNNGIATLSTDLNSDNNSITRQGASAGGPNTNWTDPGGDPTGPPIPVGDGWVFLLLLAAGYGIIKKKFFGV
jgi:hypothetical protein